MVVVQFRKRTGVLGRRVDIRRHIPRQHGRRHFRGLAHGRQAVLAETTVDQIQQISHQKGKLLIGLFEGLYAVLVESDLLLLRGIFLLELPQDTD